MTNKKITQIPPKKKTTRLSQSDVPGYSLEHALRIPKALSENYAAKPSAPLRVASAMNVQPGSGPFRQLCGASIAYGLTEGGYNAEEISITPLGKRVVRPTVEGDDLVAKREAIMKPRVLREFLTQYNGSPIPKDHIAQNVLCDMGVPEDRASQVLALIVEGAEALGLITEIKGRQYVDLAGVTPSVGVGDVDNLDDGLEGDVGQTAEVEVDPIENEDSGASEAEPKARGLVSINRKVFITHGKNKKFVEPIKKLLAFGEMEAVVSVEKQSVSQPVPDKVMNDMRACGAAIIHVEDELKLLDQDEKEQVVLNPNVLIEIGAAMALYGKRFILLVKRGVSLPSNLQGLYEVRYDGDELDGGATIQLLEAINEMKRTPAK